MLKDRKMTVVGRLEGLIQPEDFINQLTFIMDANQTYLMSERLERYGGSKSDSLEFVYEAVQSIFSFKHVSMRPKALLQKIASSVSLKFY